jgi:hypothetical protein
MLNGGSLFEKEQRTEYRVSVARPKTRCQTELWRLD